MTRASRALPIVAFSALVACGEPEGPPAGPSGEGGIGADVELGFNSCPEYQFSLVLPQRIPAGERAAAAAAATDPDGNRVTYRWRATSGSFTERSRAVTFYECDEGGSQTIKVIATDADNCASEQVFDIVCLDE